LCRIYAGKAECDHLEGLSVLGNAFRVNRRFMGPIAATQWFDVVDIDCSRAGIGSKSACGGFGVRRSQEPRREAF